MEVRWLRLPAPGPPRRLIPARAMVLQPAPPVNAGVRPPPPAHFGRYHFPSNLAALGPAVAFSPRVMPRTAEPRAPPPTEAPPPTGPVRMYGPDVGDHFAHHTPQNGDAGTQALPTSTRSQWIDGDSRQQLSSLDLYVHMHRTTAKLGTFVQDTTPGTQELAPPALKLDHATAKALELTAPTHTLSIACDCVAPRARLDLYVVEAQRASHPQELPASVSHGAPHPRGWRLASADVVHGLEMGVVLPLVLDEQWTPAESAGPLHLAVVMEALDEDGHVLSEPNAETMYFTAERVADSGAWRLHNGAQTVYIHGFAMQLHQLFGMTAHQDGPTVHEGEEDTSHAMGLDTDLNNDATECPICMTLEPTTILLPCTHALCLECATRIRESVEKSRTHDVNNGRAPRLRYACPICRASIQSMLALSR